VAGLSAGAVKDRPNPTGTLLKMTLPIKAILVGCGAMSAEWIRSAKELNVELVSLVDINPTAAQQRAQEFQIDAPIFAKYREAIAQTPADALFDCTIPAMHKEVASAAMQAGLHVLEEKPLALTLTDANELVSLSEQTRRLHVIQQNRLFNRGVRLLRRMISDGVIGEVTTVHTDFFIAPYFGGFRETMPHVLLIDMAIHPFDVARFLIGANAESALCEEWNPVNSAYGFGASVTTFFRMTNSVRFSYRGSWCAEGFRTSWDACWRVIGTKGTLLWDGYDDVRAERFKARSELLSEQELVLPQPDQEPPAALTRGHYSVMAQFVRALRNEGPLPETRSADNIHSLAMVMAATSSAEAGRWVEVKH
jgi:predicted dehydrogenase